MKEMIPLTMEPKTFPATETVEDKRLLTPFFRKSAVLAIMLFQFIDCNSKLLKNANASENENVPQTINNNIVLPEGKALGDSKAPVSIYEFSSFGCNSCNNCRALF